MESLTISKPLEKSAAPPVRLCADIGEAAFNICAGCPFARSCPRTEDVPPSEVLDEPIELAKPLFEASTEQVMGQLASGGGLASSAIIFEQAAPVLHVSDTKLPLPSAKPTRPVETIRRPTSLLESNPNLRANITAPKTPPHPETTIPPPPRVELRRPQRSYMAELLDQRVPIVWANAPVTRAPIRPPKATPQPTVRPVIPDIPPTQPHAIPELNPTPTAPVIEQPPPKPDALEPPTREEPIAATPLPERSPNLPAEPELPEPAIPSAAKVGPGVVQPPPAPALAQLELLPSAPEAVQPIVPEPETSPRQSHPTDRVIPGHTVAPSPHNSPTPPPSIREAHYTPPEAPTPPTSIVEPLLLGFVSWIFELFQGISRLRG